MKASRQTFKYFNFSFVLLSVNMSIRIIALLIKAHNYGLLHFFVCFSKSWRSIGGFSSFWFFSPIGLSDLDFL